MKKLKIFTVILLLAITKLKFAYAESLDEFIGRHPTIEKDPIVNQAVRQWAWYMAMLDVQRRNGDSDHNKIRILLDNWGEQYGAVSIRKIATDCRIGEQLGSGIQLNKRECKIVISNDRK